VRAWGLAGIHEVAAADDVLSADAACCSHKQQQSHYQCDIYLILWWSHSLDTKLFVEEKKRRQFSRFLQTCRLHVNPYYASFPASRQASRQIKFWDIKIEESEVREIPLFRVSSEEEGAQNLKRIKQILRELYFPQLRQHRQVT